MTLYCRSALARLALMLTVLIFAGMACSLSGGGDKKDSESKPTIPATITPPLTKTPIPTFTAFPTLTPFQGGGFQPVPTATRISLNPTPLFFTPFPTWTPAFASATPYPYDVRISYPVDGSQIAGYVTVVGSASHPRFLQYALEWGPDPNPGNLWYPITSPQTHPIVNGGLGAVNTTQTADGVYQIRLHIWLNDGTETFDVATGIRISNNRPTAVPTLTPTPRPNRPPVINPVPSQEVNSGSTLDLTVTTSDPDGDAVNLFVASSNNAIAAAQVTGLTSIRVTGMTAGVATISVTANDNRGGLTTTAFIVTVKGQNRAPTISPILAQTLDVGQTLDVTVAASDPDGDALTVSAASDNTAIVTASSPNVSAVRLTGVAVGTANVTVTANDGKGGVINTTFRVDVGEPNQPPTINPILAQTMTVGDSLDVLYTATDPDGDAITAEASSDTLSIVTASVTAPGNIRLVAVGAGPSTVTLSVNDGVHSPTIATFPVTVVTGNVAPTINPIDPQTMSVGEPKDVNYTVIDPEGDVLTQNVSSDTPAVVTAGISTPGTIALNAVSSGTATITLTVNDGNNPDVSLAFTVSVAAVNLPPAIETIFPQTVNLDVPLDVPYAASDPDGDPLTEEVSSDNLGVVTANISVPGTITLNGISAGSATVTLSVNDGHNPAVTMPISVTVIAPNNPPTVNPIDPQTVNVGEPKNVLYTAVDTDGDPLTEEAISNNTGVATASVTAPGTITVTGLGAGTAAVTLTVSDGINPPVSVVFDVTVVAQNNNPTIAGVGPQSVDVGGSLPVPIQASDLDGDVLTLTAVSNNPGVATAVANGPAEVLVTGVTPGVATITVDANDGRGGVASISFDVTVVGVNNPPAITPIEPQSLTVGEQKNVTVIISDSDGDPVTLTVLSQNLGVVTAESFGTDTIALTGVGEGVTDVNVTADDARGGVTNSTFSVTVSSAAPTFDLMAYPVLPNISPAMGESMRQLYQSAVQNFGAQGGAFSKVGGAGVASQNFLAPFASDQYNLGNFGSLQATIDFYRATPVRPSVDPAINSLSVRSIAAGENEFNADQLMMPVASDPLCQGVGASPLACEYNLTKPAIALISFDASNVIYMDPAAFRSTVQSLVQTTMTEHGAIPVLATIPATDSVSTEQLTEYNRAIVEVATQFGGTGLPLWNLWRAMQERGITNPYGVAPEGPANFGDAALSYGYNIRNLTALQVLESVRQAAGIN